MNDSGRLLTKFYNDVGEKYPEEEQVYQTLRGKLRKKFVLSYLTSWRGRILDIGCNRGMYLDAYKGGKKFGVDISKPVLANAASIGDLKLALADAERLQCFRMESFEHVLCSEVLEHCLHPQRVFAGIARVLKKNGTVLITTPNYNKKKPEWIDLGTLKEYGVESECSQGYFHTAYKPLELAQMAAKAGLHILESGTLEKEIKYAAKLPVIFLLAVRLLNKIVRSKKIHAANERFFHRATNIIYQIGYRTRFEKLLLPFFPEGPRSFVLAKKI